MTTSVNWTAYKVTKVNYCEPDEIIGYFQTKGDAELARISYIKEHGLPPEGICCNQSKLVEIDEILIK